MAIGEALQEHCREMQEESESDEFECADDSDDDPSFEIVEETRSTLSKLSIKKPGARKCKAVDVKLESELEREAVGDEILKLDEKDEKSFEKVEQLIKGSHLEKLKLDQCKVYLRKYGLRLTGNKGVLISRIREHQEIIDSCGEKKYPPESFVFNCKGDACLGDVVIFEQNVYEMFSIASRSATGPPCGTRTVAGRIVKESYGVAKQQHTFTIEVLWSKGVKPLPPLQQLLIKGRNLYRIKTMRQRWADEGERLKVLQEKHGRGSRARYSREIRIQEKENYKGMKIKRKNVTVSRIPADKENQHPQKADVQQMNILNNKEYKHGQEVRSNVTSFASTQQTGDDGAILQPPNQRIFGKPTAAEHAAVFSAQASSSTENNYRTHVGTQQASRIRNFQYLKHGGSQHHYHAKPHVHQRHYMAKPHEFQGGLQHKNSSYHMHQTSWVNHFIHVPLQQEHPGYQRQSCHYFSQGQ